MDFLKWIEFSSDMPTGIRDKINKLIMTQLNLDNDVVLCFLNRFTYKKVMIMNFNAATKSPFSM